MKKVWPLIILGCMKEVVKLKEMAAIMLMKNNNNRCAFILQPFLGHHL